MKLIFALLLTVACCSAAALRIEAETLEMAGGWETSHGSSRVVGRFLFSGTAPGGAAAAGAYRVATAGRYRLWVRSKDYPEQLPGTRYFSLRLGTHRSALIFGKHGRAGMDGWDWEDGGLFDLAAGPVLVVVGEIATTFARCDALVLTTDLDWKPAGLPAALRIAEATRAPLEITSLDAVRPLLPPPVTDVQESAAAVLDNGQVRVTFHRALSGGAPVVAQRVAIGGRALAADPGAESYRVLWRPAEQPPTIAAARVYPSWDTAFAPPIRISAGGASIESRSGPATAPWVSGQSYPLRPSAVRQRDAETVELEFPPLAEGRLSATWHLPAGASAAEVRLHFTPTRAGHVSLGYHGIVAAAPADLDFILLPFMFHGRRLPPAPVTLLSATTPTPLTMVNRGGLNYGIAAVPEDLAGSWPAPETSRYAFGIRNESGQAQPFAYSPVLGLAGSASNGRRPVDARLLVWMQSGNWYDAWTRVATACYGLRDYRRPVYGSLSDTALNLYDLVRSGLAWDERAKGPWNIESRNTVTHSSPLVYLSLYLLTGEDAMYRRYALPALEYLLSRSSPHFAAVEPYGPNYYTGAPLGGPASPFGATVFASAYAMTQGRSGAFGELARTPNGEARRTGSNGHSQPFDDDLALWKLTGDPQWKHRAIAGADLYLAAHIARLPETDVGTEPFVNVSFLPDWEGLLHVYEATGERRFLDGAVEGARRLLTTLWVHPVVPPGDLQIHPGGSFRGEPNLWYFGDYRNRLGLYDERGGAAPPAKVAPARIPEASVPAWQVSNVGLGLEQPITYVHAGGDASILMSVWAPNLLRLAALTGDRLFLTAARNAAIGRFTNYPGYYAVGYTNAYQKPDYPTQGPDVTSLYYHHIPSFTAFVLDYLFTDVEMRSAGQVRFPATRQNGYVWFDSRLYGHAPGQVYGQAAWPWLHRTAARVDSIDVDTVLAHGDGRFHAVLLNQVGEPRTVRVRLDAAALGRKLEDAAALVRVNNGPAAEVRVRGGEVTISLPPRAIAVLTVEGTHIDVPTHRVAPPEHVALPGAPAIARHDGAIGTLIAAPPFAARDLYVWVPAGRKEVTVATLYWRVGEGPEQRKEARGFPCEFSVRVDDPSAPVTWRVERR